MRYTPDRGFVGSDVFSFTVSDGKDTSGAAIVQVSVISPAVNAAAAVANVSRAPVRRPVVRRVRVRRAGRH